MPTHTEATAIIKSCSHFGFCTATCPTYHLTHDENESPRGRIELIRAMLEKGGAPEPETVRHLDSCLSCLACVSTCAAKVDYMHLIDYAKTYVERHFRRSLMDRMFRGLIAAVVPNRHLFKAAMVAGRYCKVFGRVLGGRSAGLLDFVPSALPRESADLCPGTYEARGERRWRVALLAGCAQRVLAPQINAATVRLLRRHGCEVVVVRGVECCGALTLHMGRGEGLGAAKRNIDALLEENRFNPLDAVIVNASGCGTTMKDYGHLFEHDPLYRDKARQVSALTADVSEFIHRIGLASAARKKPFRVAYHDACSLRNGQRVTRQPRALLRSAGFSIVDVPETHFCCGSAGTYNLLQPLFAKQLGERKARHAESTGAAMLAVGNIGCITQISRYTKLPVLHTVELLDWATGGPEPVALRGRQLAEYVESTAAAADMPPPAQEPIGPGGSIGIW